MARQITIDYQYAEDFRLEHCDGAFGGAGGKGDLRIKFYCDDSAMIKSVSHDVNESTGLLGNITNMEPKDANARITRRVHFGIIISPAEAKNLAQWILKQLEPQQPKTADVRPIRN